MENQKEQPTLLISRSFADIDHFSEALQGWNANLTQLSPGKCNSQLDFAQCGGLQIFQASFNQIIRIKGEKRPGSLTVATLLGTGDRFNLAHNAIVEKDCLFGLDPSREINVVSSEVLQLGIVSLDLECLQQEANLMGLEQLDLKRLKCNFSRPRPDLLILFNNYLRQITYLIKANPIFFSEPQTQRLLTEDFFPILIDTVKSHDFKNSVTKFRRAEIVKKVEDFILDNVDRPLTLKDLCLASGTNQRSLFYGFEQIFNMSPISYLKIQRLNGVRRALKKTNPQLTTVMFIANQWGFFSMGHFSRDYKQMFGELPSETLKKSDSSNLIFT